MTIVPSAVSGARCGGEAAPRLPAAFAPAPRFERAP